MDHFGGSECCEEATLTLVSHPHELTEFDSLVENFDPKSTSLYVGNHSLHHYDEGSTPIQDNCEIMASLPKEMATSSSCCDDMINQPRVRKLKRPFSPQAVESSLKTSARGKPKRKGTTRNTKMSTDKEAPSESFSCDRCGSQTIVNPSRRRLPPGQVKKAPTMRKKIDPTSKQVLSLCNACGLAFSRPPRKEKRVMATIDDRDQYITEAVAFAKSLAERLGKPAAERLFCPSFKNRPCGCLQTYISHQDDDESSVESRVESLLQLFSTACDLNRRRNLFPQYQQGDMKIQEDINTNSVEKKQRQRDYESFILETRQILREKLRLCERACQRILLYSNNFLHKKLKSIPEQSSRISRQCGRNVTSQLKSIDELGHISCCVDNCSRLALTHSTLLMEWRKQATQGQRQARRVLAEMLTPSGGTKANCYKFITMVTGCAPTTISSVSNQMRVTKGDREPPEHGLKKWHRVNPRKNSKHPMAEIGSKQGDPSSGSVIAGAIEEGSKQLLEQQRKELEEAKHQLYLQKQELDRCHQIIDQHLQQQSSAEDNLANNPLWKVNVIRSSLDGEENSTPLLNLPVEPNVTMIPELASGQTVEIIDLVPGTYIAVPSSFDSSTILTMTSNTKESATSSCSFQSEDFSSCQEIILSDELQSSLPNSCKTNNLLLHSENGVPTIYKFSAVSAEADTILDGVHSQMNPLEGGDAEVFVSAPTVCDGTQFPESEVNQQPVISTHVLETVSSIDAASNNNQVTNYKDIGTSSRTSVITPSRSTDPEKTVCHIDNSMASFADVNSSQTPVKSIRQDGCVGAYEMSSVILLPSHQSETPCSSFNTLDRFFE